MVEGEHELEHRVVAAGILLVDAREARERRLPAAAHPAVIQVHRLADAVVLEVMQHHGLVVARQRDDMRALFGEFHDHLQDFGAVVAAVDVVAEEDEQVLLRVIGDVLPERQQAQPVAVDVPDSEDVAEGRRIRHDDEAPFSRYGLARRLPELLPFCFDFF